MKKLTQKQWLEHLKELLKDVKDEADGQRKAMTRDFLVIYAGITKLSKTIRSSIALEGDWAESLSADLETALKTLEVKRQYTCLSFDFSHIDEIIKVEKTRFIPPDLPAKRGDRQFSENLYDFYRIWLYPFERFIRGRYVRFQVRRSIAYNSRYFLGHIFKLAEGEFKRISEESEYVLKQVKDILDFTIEEREATDNIQSGLRRAAALIDPLIVDFIGVKGRTRGMLESALKFIRRNVMEESMLARTTAEDFIWTARITRHTFRQIAQLSQKFWKLKIFFSRSGEEVARNVPKVFEKIERSISLEEGPSSFLLELNKQVEYRPELSRVFSDEPAEMPLFYGREDILKGLSAEYTRFKSGGISLVVLTGGAGVGKKSVNKNSMKEWRDTVEWDIEKRIIDPFELDLEIARLLELPSNDIVGEIHKGPRRIIMLRRMERLYRRQMGGYDAFRRFLFIVSSTSSRVMWVLQTNDIAFSFMNGVFGLGKLATRVLHIEPLRRKEMEEMLLHRLHFTGYRYYFLPDLELSDRARRKLKDQKKLKSLYFDRIFELSLGYPLSAIFFAKNSVRRVSDTTIFFRTPPKARFDALGTLNEKLWFKGLLEARGHFPEEIAGQRLPVVALAENMGILERRFLSGGELLTAKRTMEPFIRANLIDSGIISGRGRSIIS